MKTMFLALAFALSAIPAIAQTDSGPPQLTPQQRQAMRQTFEAFAAKEEQLHQQMRAQILNGLSPVHRRAVGAAIGELAVAPNPDPAAVAKWLDTLLSPGERQRVMTAHAAFFGQSRQLHTQLRTELQNEIPADHPPTMNHEKDRDMPAQLDAGNVLLMTLSPHPMKGMGDHGAFMMHVMEDGPPH